MSYREFDVTPVTFVTHLSSMTQFEEVSRPCMMLREWRKAIPRAMSSANVNRKFQLRGILSFCSTSLRLPFGQYSLMMAILGRGSLMVAPMNLHKFWWSKVLWDSPTITHQVQLMRPLLPDLKDLLSQFGADSITTKQG